MERKNIKVVEIILIIAIILFAVFNIINYRNLAALSEGMANAPQTEVTTEVPLN